jgi:CRP-like cAMP-binding protein
MEHTLPEHAFLENLAPRHLKTLVECASECKLPVGHDLWRQGEEANGFYLVHWGEIAVGLDIPHQGFLRLDTLGPGDVLGWSWFLAPHRSHFDARTMTPVEALLFDTTRLRKLCEQDRELRCELLSRIAPIIVRRLEGSQEKLLELHR